MFFIENFKLAISSLRANKMRSFLTMLGIIIGISSVITIMTLGEIGKASIGKEFEGFGTRRVYVGINWNDDIKQTDFINNNDIKKLRKVFSKEIEYLSPQIWGGSGKAKKNKAFGNIYITGVNEEYKFISKINVIKGRFLNKPDIKSRKNVVVINKELAQKLFKRINVVGETIKIEDSDFGQSYTIVGIYENPPSIFDRFGKSDKTEVYLPISIVMYDNLYDSLEIQLSEKCNVDETCDKISKFLSRIKGKKDIFKTESAKKQMNIIDNVLNKISLGIGAIAAISLLVGGIGVMNIMLVSVTERTKEIGIRKALGAKRKDILFQFLVESMIISAVGGLIGISLGLGISNLIAIFLKVSPKIPIGVVIIAVSFSAIVGIFFGIYPANKAAKLDPIEALRYE
ncbi:ABC transporter permease [Tepidibacter thalassicus]|uniref:Putative ABC transport system permease protein n=1 Tax=Tepidibacter thalassicus DSM 15285 TaxID=1123350 RepID=A0A1M5P2J5_9FIRM|nr:ABC transporter permease [Tepidibacter thalassicus]SHG95935.1 putative ABC transport system permease protein [Tepidibacter thalassicus DSM 15285]